MATTPAVRALIHELATPLTVLMSASDILHHRVPPIIEPPIDQLRDLSHQFGRDIVALRASLNKNIELQSPIRAAEQIQQWAAEWRQHYAAHLIPLVDQIQQAAVKLPEPLLDRMLNESLSNGLRELDRVLSRLETLQPGDLEFLQSSAVP